MKSMDKFAKVVLYKDDGFSGGSLDRPAIQQLIRDAKARQITHVVVDLLQAAGEAGVRRRGDHAALEKPVCILLRFEGFWVRKLPRN